MKNESVKAEHPMLTDRIAQALALAVEAHDGQKRKGTAIPYITNGNGGSGGPLGDGAQA